LWLFSFGHLIFEEQLVLEFIEEQLFHLFYFLSGLLILLNPFPFLFIVDVPFAICGLVEGFLEQIFDSGL